MSIILLIADDAQVRATLSSAFEREGHFVWEVAGAEEASRHLRQWTPDLVIISLNQTEKRMMDLLEGVRRERPQVHILTMPTGTSAGREGSAQTTFPGDGKDLNKTSQRADEHLTVRLSSQAYN